MKALGYFIENVKDGQHIWDKKVSRHARIGLIIYLFMFSTPSCTTPTPGIPTPCSTSACRLFGFNISFIPYSSLFFCLSSDISNASALLFFLAIAQRATKLVGSTTSIPSGLVSIIVDWVASVSLLNLGLIRPSLLSSGCFISCGSRGWLTIRPKCGEQRHSKLGQCITKSSTLDCWVLLD